MYQMTFFEIADKLSNRSHLAVGALGEEWARQTLTNAGYIVMTTGRGERRGDLMAIDENGVMTRVEVKTARPDKRGRYQFCVKKNDRYGHTNCHDSDVVVMLAVTKTGRCVPFVLKPDDLGDVKKITFASDPDKYAGKWSKFRVNRLETLF